MTTTQPLSDDLVVTQADRDAAADAEAISSPTAIDFHHRMRRGNLDHYHLVQAFARHRLTDHAEQAAEIQRLREALATLEHCAGQVHRMGTQTGTQWFRLAGALIIARTALNGKDGDR
jgi:hypothetical protein